MSDGHPGNCQQLHAIPLTGDALALLTFSHIVDMGEVVKLVLVHGQFSYVKRTELISSPHAELVSLANASGYTLGVRLRNDSKENELWRLLGALEARVEVLKAIFQHANTDVSLVLITQNQETAEDPETQERLDRLFGENCGNADCPKQRRKVIMIDHRKAGGGGCGSKRTNCRTSSGSLFPRTAIPDQAEIARSVERLMAERAERRRVEAEEAARRAAFAEKALTLRGQRPKEVRGETELKVMYFNDADKEVMRPYVVIGIESSYPNIEPHWAFSNSRRGLKCFFIGKDRFKLVEQMEQYWAAVRDGKPAAFVRVKGIKIVGEAKSGKSLHCHLLD